MDTQLLHNDILKSEASQFQSQRNRVRKDKTGRYLLGQQYVWALINWLADYPSLSLSGFFTNEIYTNVSTWLGNRSPQKEKLIRILVAKFTHDWKSLKKFNHNSKNKELAYFANSMEIWHYTFPKKLDMLLQDIGKMEAENNDPHGNYTIDKDVITNIENEFAVLCNLMNSGSEFNYIGSAEKIDLINNWLIASITKTLKDQTGISG
jgi:hypothetical protein